MKILDINHDRSSLLSDHYDTWISGVSISVAAALAGSMYGLQAAVSSGTDTYARRDFTQLTSAAYRCRIYFAPNSLSMADGDSYLPFRIQESGGPQKVRGNIRRFSGNYQTRILVSHDAGTWISNWVTIADNEHYIEFLIKYASSAVASDGYAVLWVDGVKQDEGEALDIFDISKPDRLQVGTMGVDVGTSGNFFIDEIILRDDDLPIGPRIPQLIGAATTIFDYAGIRNAASELESSRHVLSADQIAFLLATVENKSIFQGNWAIDGERVNGFQWDEIDKFIAATERALMIDLPSARVYSSIDITLSSGVWTAISMDGVRWDNDNLYDVSNPSRLTIKEPGLYTISASVAFEPDTTGLRAVAIRLNGSVWVTMQQDSASTYSGAYTVFDIGTIYELIEGDYMELWCFQVTGSDLDVLSLGNYSPEFSVKL